MLIEAGFKNGNLYLIQSGRLGAWIFPDEKDHSHIENMESHGDHAGSETPLYDVKKRNTIAMHKGRRVRVRGVRAVVFEFFFVTIEFVTPTP